MSEEKNRKSESKEEPPKNKRHFNQEQYDRLLECSKKGLEGIKEWNEWWNTNLHQNPHFEIHLEGADLSSAYLKGAQLNAAKLKDATLNYAHLEGAELNYADLKNTYLWDTHLEGAQLAKAHLEGASLFKTHLEGTNLSNAHLEDASLTKAHLEGADFRGVFVDGSSFIDSCFIDSKTDFTMVGLDDARIEPGLKQSLKNNIRKKRWQSWCKKNTWGRPTRIFFWMSDYGTSTTKIIISFFSLTFIFAIIYYLFGLFGQGIIANLFKVGEINLPWWQVLFRVVYFSVVTMTTLGFGDMYANSQSITGCILLTIQVLFGYVLLGALITRLAIVFTGEGPALDSEFDMGEKKG